MQPKCECVHTTAAQTANGLPTSNQPHHLLRYVYHKKTRRYNRVIDDENTGCFKTTFSTIPMRRIRNLLFLITHTTHSNFYYTSPSTSTSTSNSTLILILYSAMNCLPTEFELYIPLSPFPPYSLTFPPQNKAQGSYSNLR
ncbi:hypothetical protein CAAN1_10S04764 [[Candida] anglica]|uniref:Uncharacterized protein n=1 Tax=[Candida] anglica TaxID=148631 RepID=A0ABP0EER8_9ASCO